MRLASLRKRDGSLIDRGFVVFFPGPASFTGEDVGEFHLHGGRAVVAAMLDHLASFDDVHQAEPGEFTRRAFVNGKLDLTAAEGLADLVDAETEFQRQLALENAGGRQRALYENWRARLLEARAFVEADLDFDDEADVPGSVADRVWPLTQALRDEIARHLAGLRDGEIVRDGFKVVLAGPPNAGKSSLLNRLAGRDVAIVTPEAGTTRDVLEVVLDLGGARVRIFDTAGLRDAEGLVESIGIERARSVAREADLVVVLAEIGSELPVLEEGIEHLGVASKADLRPDHAHPFRLSVESGEGVDRLLREIATKAGARATAALNTVVPTRRRHAERLTEVIDGLDDALAAGAIELQAEGLRRAGAALGMLTGAIGTEEVLGAIFSRFCIGK